MKLDAIDRRLIHRLCGDITDTEFPFHKLADELGLPVAEVLKRIRAYRQGKIMRRFGAILRHQRAGFTANGMSVWRVAPQDVERVGRILAQCPAVSHAYERPTFPGWPYNVFGMIHGHSREECLDTAAELARATGISDYRVLFSTREFKKSSRIYFAETP